KNAGCKSNPRCLDMQYMPAQSTPSQITQHIMQDPTILEIIKFIGRINADMGNKLDGFTAIFACCHNHFSGLWIYHRNIKKLITREAERFRRLTGFKLQGQYTHADEV